MFYLPKFVQLIILSLFLVIGSIIVLNKIKSGLNNNYLLSLSFILPFIMITLLDGLIRQRYYFMGIPLLFLYFFDNIKKHFNYDIFQYCEPKQKKKRKKKKNKLINELNTETDFIYEIYCQEVMDAEVCVE